MHLKYFILISLLGFNLPVDIVPILTNQKARFLLSGLTLSIGEYAAR